MQLILAIDSDPRRSEQLANLVHARLQVDLVQATSAGEALHALRDRVPDLILTSPLLSPFDDGVLDEYLRDLGSAATHVQTVRIPMLSIGPKKKSAATRLFSLGRKKTQTSPAAPDGCDPKVFADEIAHYLTRSLEERSSSAKATEDRSAFAKAAEYRAATKAAPVETAPARVPAAELEPVDQFDRFDQLVDEWAPPEAIVQEFNDAQTAWSTEARTQAAPEPVVEDTHVPGSILDLRLGAPKPSEGGPASPKPAGEGGLASPKPREDGPGTHAPQRVVAAGPESYTFVEPEPVVELKPVSHEFLRPEPVESSPVYVMQDEPIEVARGELAHHEPVFIKPHRVDSEARPATPVTTRPAAPVAQTPAPSAANSAAGHSASGNSASFEAALAAIRAAWARPESTTPRATAPASPAAVKPPAGSGEVDLTNQIDALEDVDDIEDPNTSKARRKVEKPGRPEKPKARRTSGADDRNGRIDGRSDWGVLDSIG